MKTNKPAHDITVDAQGFFNSAGVARTMMEFGRKEKLFSQGDPCKNVIYILKGEVKIFVVSESGRRAVLGIVGPGDFIGEGGLAGQPMRMTTAIALTPVTVLAIDIKEMDRALRANSEFSYRFATHVLQRQIRIERT